MIFSPYITIPIFKNKEKLKKQTKKQPLTIGQVQFCHSAFTWHQVSHRKNITWLYTRHIGIVILWHWTYGWSHTTFNFLFLKKPTLPHCYLVFESKGSFIIPFKGKKNLRIALILKYPQKDPSGNPLNAKASQSSVWDTLELYHTPFCRNVIWQLL